MQTLENKASFCPRCHFVADIRHPENLHQIGRFDGLWPSVYGSSRTTIYEDFFADAWHDVRIVFHSLFKGKQFIHLLIDVSGVRLWIRICPGRN